MRARRRDSESLEDLVGAAMQGVADEAAQCAERSRRDAAQRDRRHRRNRVAAAILLPLSVALTVLNLSGVLRLAFDLPSRPASETRLAQLRLLSDAVEDLELFYQQTGRYPERPAFIGPDGPGAEDEPFSYQRSGLDRYVLSVTVDGLVMTFDSTANPDVVFAEVRGGG